MRRSWVRLPLWARRKTTTVREYRRLVTKVIVPDLGKLPLRRITIQRVDTYYASLVRERLM